ncbi:DUF6473 family protein [Ideonella livida]|uniref:DUF6473 domain-containing protein n=1 Tax=Ideonella livida TaxID=2707176 RepID=A0A7C9PKY6_9BURK|nr:DUF6473 family protein [Ideonella livida]NDY93834.1 hypothetical protein [Ideonella livida]
MGQGYQRRDFNIIDYELYQLPGLDRPLRGPDPGPLVPGGYAVALGAAQTFGCYCPVPYPRYLQIALGMPVVNFGVAGAGPSFFLQDPAYLEVINQARFVIVQVMSGRSESNSLFSSPGGEMLTRRADGVTQGAEPMYRELLQRHPPEEVAEVVRETRANWLGHCHALLDAIRVPVVLLWMSRRTPDYEEAYGSVAALFGDFPQLVNRPMFEALKARVPDVVESVCGAGMPQPFINRFTGEPAEIVMRADLGGRVKRINNYYPSPEMQLHAAQQLLPVCTRLKAAGAPA